LDNNTIAQISIWTGFTFSILQVLVIFLAMWIAGRALLRNPILSSETDLEQPEDEDDEAIEDETESPEMQVVAAEVGDEMGGEVDDQVEPELEETVVAEEKETWINRGMTIVLWLGFAGMIVLALADVLVFLRTVIGIGLGYSVLGMDIFRSNPFSTMWGTVPGGLYSLMFLMLQLVVYLEVIWVGKSFVNGGGPLRSAALTRGERWWLVLGTAGLVHEVVQGLVLALIRIELPVASPFADSGLMGFVGIFILALLLIGLGMMWINSRLLKVEIERETGQA
jgi:hypothetical protein